VFIGSFLSSWHNERMRLHIELEPSSALANKISRAHDNPSPPPRMQGLHMETESQLRSPPRTPTGRLVDVSFEHITSTTPVPSSISRNDQPVSPFSHPPDSVHPSIQLTLGEESDLINFDGPSEVPSVHVALESDNQQVRRSIMCIDLCAKLATLAAESG
jgi:hypothetical protein